MIHYITTIGVGNPWVGNELRQMRQKQIPFELHALHPQNRDCFRSADVAEISARTRTLYPLPAASFALSLLLAPLLFRGRFLAALGNSLFGRRESFRVRLTVIWHFLVACHWARGLRQLPVSAVHSQWIHSSGSVGMYGAWLLDVPFSFTGHATDLFRDRSALLDKIRRADRIACISTFHRDFYLEHGAHPDQLVLVYCGIDTELFRGSGDARVPSRTFRLLASGRLVEKKGFADLIQACRQLSDRGIDFSCTIAGSGPLEAELRQQIERDGLEDKVRLTGEELKQEDIPTFMRSGDAYCLPCVWAKDGDVDGLPQMLMEAMACGLPVVSTRLVGIPDLIVDGESGLLVEPGAPDQIAEALARLQASPELRAALAEGGRRKVEQDFRIELSVEPLAAYFRDQMGLPDPRRPGDGALGSHSEVGTR